MSPFLRVLLSSGASKTLAKNLIAVTYLVFLLIPAQSLAQAGPLTTSAEPFKLGTFRIEGIPTVGIVLRDQYIIELDAVG